LTDEAGRVSVVEEGAGGGARGYVDVVSWAIVAVALLLLVFAPLVFTDYFVGVILTKALWLGIAAASLIFLASYAGMVSLGQVGLYAIAGMMFANLVAADGGLDAAWNPWVAVVAALLIATLAGLLFGAVAARSVGIYFLMITLALGVLVYYFFAQVTELSGFGGVNAPELPALIGNPGADPVPLFYVTLVASVLVFLGIRYIVRTPFGLTMQGLRDDPDRMRALGFNVALHRTLAFTVGAFIAAVAGILSVWYNQRISPGSISLGQTIDVLVIAVIGGLYRLEGAWVGAIFFALLDNYSREHTPNIGDVLGPERFNTLIGIVFLVIVLISPGGLVGLWDRIRDWIGPSGDGGARAGPGVGEEPSAPVGEPLGPRGTAGKPGVS
jgi:branched-chain amino acid transport system permease protein